MDDRFLEEAFDLPTPFSLGGGAEAGIEEDLDEDIEVVCRAPTFSPTGFLVDVWENWMTDETVRLLRSTYDIPTSIPTGPYKPASYSAHPRKVWCASLLQPFALVYAYP